MKMFIPSSIPDHLKKKYLIMRHFLFLMIGESGFHIISVFVNIFCEIIDFDFGSNKLMMLDVNWTILNEFSKHNIDKRCKFGWLKSYIDNILA